MNASAVGAKNNLSIRVFIMKSLIIQIILSTIVCTHLIAAGVVPVVEECDHKLKPNESRRIMHATVMDNQVLLITRESESQWDFVGIGCFTFDQNNQLRDVRTYRLKKRSESNDLFHSIYAFGQDRDIVLGGQTATFRPPANYLWFSALTGVTIKHPELIMQDADYSLDKWWLLKVGKSWKLFILKERLLETKDSEIGLEWQGGWLHCYNLDDTNKPRLEAVARIENDVFRTYWVECAADGNDVYIWQTICKKGEFRERTLRVARWRSHRKLDWTVYQTKPQVYFAVDHYHGSTALVIEWAEKNRFKLGLLNSQISLARASVPEMTMTKIGSFQAHDVGAGFQLMRTKDSSYPWAGLIAPQTNNKMFLVRITDEYKAVTKVLTKPFEIRDVELVNKGTELYLFRVFKDNITLTPVEDFWTK